MINWFIRRQKSRKPYFTNSEWIKALKNPPDNEAIEELRNILIRGLKPALSKYIDRELEQFVEDVAQDSMLKILNNLNSFRGESKFTTWAMKISVREGLTELRRKRYDNISLEDLKFEGNDNEIRSMEIADSQPSPERLAHLSHLMQKMMTIIDQELTEKQKKAIQAIMLHGLPIGVVAEQMGTNRNALYKVVHDARLKLKNRFEMEGINPDQILNDL